MKKSHRNNEGKPLKTSRKTNKNRELLLSTKRTSDKMLWAYDKYLVDDKNVIVYFWSNHEDRSVDQINSFFPPRWRIILVAPIAFEKKIWSLTKFLSSCWHVWLRPNFGRRPNLATKLLVFWGIFLHWNFAEFVATKNILSRPIFLSCDQNDFGRD